MEVGKRGWGISGALSRAFWLCLLLPLAADGAQQRVVVIADQQSPVHQQFIAAFRQHLPAATVVETSRDSVGRASLRGAALIVTLGNLAARGVSTLTPAAPTINALITHNDWLRLADSDSLSQQTALFIEQSPVQQLALVRSALPARQSVTVVLGPASLRFRAELEQGCNRMGLRCEMVEASDEAGIERALRHAADSDRVLLVPPDAQLVNAATARNLILGAYRRGIALIGYSQALVKAGALMAVHSTPAQLGKDTARMASEILADGVHPLPAGRHPMHYSVSVNYQLARALGLSLASEKILLQTMQTGVRRE
jgi:ABC-type uncharacterized transport system substrate-binding protein